MKLSEKYNRQWEHVASWRRLLLILLIIVPTLFAVRLMSQLLPNKGATLSELLMLIVYGVLVAWISIGFWTATLGFLVILRKYNRFSPLATIKKIPLSNPLSARTAILFPIYNEDVKRTLAGISTELEELRAIEHDKNFDFFILSDSTNPDAWVEEEAAWFRLCKGKKAFGQIFYRHRKHNVQRKSGNVADFCRRWGKKYKYMIVFDADSIMSGKSLVSMVRIMELKSNIGILQTPPSSVNKSTLISRAGQFANKLYGPLFAAGLHFWQLGDAQYWGHNAIIRIEPFMKHCQLPILPGKGPLGGEILSHDFVEAALMRRAGYSVWLAYDMEGSYEEAPPTLIDELIRDRRWCQGNLQHSKLLFMGGLFPTHRALFLNGIMSYTSALLWLIFLLFSSVQAIAEIVVLPQYFSNTKVLFPTWRIWNPHWALALLGSTAVLLFLPKLWSLLLVIFRGGNKSFGGMLHMILSIFLEVIVSTLLAPVRMLNHSAFVLTTICGYKVSWSVQTREEAGTTWSDAFRFHWWNMLIGILWGGLLWIVNPGFFIWISPIVGALVLSIPLSVYTSRASIGLFLKKHKILLTPEEYSAPPELAYLQKENEKEEPYSALPFKRQEGFLRAVVDPKVNALHISLLLNHSRYAKQTHTQIDLAEKALKTSPKGLTKAEKLQILIDPAQLNYLHRRVWELPQAKAKDWGL